MARLLVISGDAGAGQFDIDQGVTLGREKHNSIPLPKARGCSRDHAKIWRVGPGKYAVADLGSTNGTLVNDEKTSRADLADGDHVQVGDVIFEFHLDEDEKPKPKIRKQEDNREDFAAILRGEKKREDRPVATQVEGQAAIQMKERILQYHKKSNTANQAAWDMSQMAGPAKLALGLLALAIVGGLFYLAMHAFG
jgi:pSer/pThr/pTyr-binding forkhead associated (FHA) protein